MLQDTIKGSKGLNLVSLLNKGYDPDQVVVQMGTYNFGQALNL